MELRLLRDGALPGRGRFDRHARLSGHPSVHPSMGIDPDASDLQVRLDSKITANLNREAKF